MLLRVGIDEGVWKDAVPNRALGVIFKDGTFELWDYEEERYNKIMGFEIAKTISAFMNSEGGILLIGVKDDETILGLKKDFKLLKKPNKLNTDNLG